MAFDFPASPTVNQTFTPPGGPTYVWNGSVWLLSQGMTGSGVTTSDNPPPAPVPGQLWFEADSGNTYIWYVDADGGQWIQFNVAPAPTFMVTQTLVTASGTYTKPADLRFLMVEGCGGGGGGGGAAATAASTFSAGGGGAAGGYARKLFKAADLPATVAMTIGAGGSLTNGGNGLAGGTTSFGTLMTMNGGGGGLQHGPAGLASAWLGTAGATATGGDINCPGGPSTGALIQTANGVAIGGNGGNSQFGGGGIGGANNVGGIPTAYGAGGGGASNGPSTAAKGGGLGMAGAIVLTEYR